MQSVIQLRVIDIGTLSLVVMSMKKSVEAYSFSLNKVILNFIFFLYQQLSMYS